MYNKHIVAWLYQVLGQHIKYLLYWHRLNRYILFWNYHINVNSLWLCHDVTRFVEVLHCFNHKCMWDWWRLPSLSYLKEYGRKENHPNPKLWRKTNLCVNIIYSRNCQVPHCASDMNTHGSLTLTLLCFEHECTWKCKVDFTVPQSWMHMEWCQNVFQSWMHMES